jgi:hypothetical protein
MLEKLDGAFVRFRSFPGTERSQVTAMSGFRVFLAGVKPILSGFHLTNHSAPLCFHESCKPDRVKPSRLR